MSEAWAAVYNGTPGQIELRRLPVPEPGAGELLVRVLGCTLCASDLHSVAGRRSVPVPTVLGHEIVGEIVQLGDGTVDPAGQALSVGDRVTWAVVASCGACYFCVRGLPQKCLHAVKYGHATMTPGRELLGGLAEVCLLVLGTAVVRLPEALPLSVACPLSCATATVAAALEAAGEVRGRTFCVFGAGMLGLTACAMVRGYGADAVVCVEPNPARRARADRFGATAVEVADGGPHGFDAVLEMSGHPAAFAEAWRIVRTGGSLVLVGSVFPGPPVAVELERIVRRQLTIRGVHNYAPSHLLDAVDFMASAHTVYPFAELVAEWFPLADVASAFRRAAEPDVVRVGVAPREAAL